MNLKCHFSALESTLLSIENKLIIFDLTIFNCGISIISFLINLKTSPFLSQKPIFLLVFIRFHPIQFSQKPLYMRELDNIYLLTFNNKQTKQREKWTIYQKSSWPYSVYLHYWTLQRRSRTGALTRKKTRKKKRRNKMNRQVCSCKEIKSRKRHRRYCDRMRNYCYDSQEFKETSEDPGKAPGSTMMLLTI